MFKKWQGIALIAGLVLALALAASNLLFPGAMAKATDGVDIHLDMDDTAGFQEESTLTVENGEQFTLEVFVVAGEQQVAGVDVFLNFDTDELEVKAITADTSGLGTQSNLDMDNTNGYADYSALKSAIQPYPTGTFRLCTMTFEAKGLTVSSSLSFNQAVPRNTDVGFEAESVLNNVYGATVKILEVPVVDFTIDPANGNITAGDNVSFTATTTSGGPVESWAWDFNNDGTVDSTAANPSWGYSNTAGTYTVKLTGTNALGSDSETKENVITVSPDAASKLAYNPAPATPVTAGATWTEFKVEIRDQYDNLTDSTANVTVTPSAGAFASGTTNKAAVAGVATFNDLTYTTTGTITVTASSGSLTSAASGDIVVNPGAAIKLVYTTQPASTGSVDDNFTTQPVLQIRDQYDNLCTSDTSTVTLAAVLASDDATSGAGALTGTSSLAAVGGVATFTDIGYTRLDTVHIKATSGSLTAAVSTPDITLTIGAASKLVYNPAPATPVAVGDTWTEFKVEIRDQYDNLTTSTANVTVTPSAGAFASGNTTRAAVAGVATFDDLTRTLAGTITVTASSGSLTSAVSGNIVVNPDTASKLAYNPVPATSVTVGATWTEFKVEIRDQYDNLTTSTANVTVTPSAGAFASGTTNKAAVAGVATFGDLKYAATGTITVTASSGSLTSAVSGDIAVRSVVVNVVTGGGGGGGGGATGTTSVAESITNSGRFTKDVTAESVDGKVELSITEDTIGKNRAGQPLYTISVKEKSAPSAPPAYTKVIGLVYDLGPGGATFDPPISLTFTYDESEIPAGAAEENLAVATWQDGNWVELEGSTVDPTSNTITAPVSHFTVFTVMAHNAPAEFEITAFDISPAVVNPDESVTIIATITNTGDLAGSHEATLMINEGVTAVEELSLAGHASQQVTFTLKPHNAGSYAVDVNGLSATLVVREAARPEEEQPPSEELVTTSEVPPAEAPWTTAEAPAEPSITQPTSPEVSAVPPALYPTPSAPPDKTQPSQISLWLIIGIAAGVIVLGAGIWQLVIRIRAS